MTFKKSFTQKLYVYSSRPTPNIPYLGVEVDTQIYVNTILDYPNMCQSAFYNS